MKPKFQFDPAVALTNLRASDPELGALIDRIGPFALELRPAASLFEALLRSIVYQQLHGKAAATIHGRVLAELAKHGGATPVALTQVSDAGLRGAGLSGNKLRAVRDLASKCMEGTVPSLPAAAKLCDEELVTRLTAVRGIVDGGFAPNIQRPDKRFVCGEIDKARRDFQPAERQRSHQVIYSHIAIQPGFRASSAEFEIDDTATVGEVALH